MVIILNVMMKHLLVIEYVEHIITWEDLRRGKAVDLKSVRSCYVYIQTGEGVAKEHKGMRNADR